MLSLAFTPFLLGSVTDKDTEQQGSQSTDQNSADKKSDNQKNNKKRSGGDDSIHLIEKLMQATKAGPSGTISEPEVMRLFADTYQNVLENNKDIRQKREEVMAALGANAIARAEFLPDVSLQGAYNFRENFEKNAPRDGERSTIGTKAKEDDSGFAANLEVRQNLFNGFRSVANYKAAINENKAKYEDYKAFEGDVVAKVFTELMEIITQSILLQANETNVAMHRELLKAAIEKMKVGDVDRSEVAYAESKCAASEAKLKAVRIKLDIGLSNFELWTGIHLKNTVLTHPSFAKFLPQTLEELKRMAAQHSHRILAGHYQAIAKKAAIKKAEAGFSPSLDLTFSGGLEDKTKKHYNHPDYDYKKVGENDHSFMNYAVGVRLVVPLDIKGVNRTAIGGAHHEYTKTQIGGAQAYDSVMSDVETDFYQLKNENAIIEAYKRKVKACEIALQGVLQELAVGAKVYIQTLKAQSDLLDARGELAEAYKARANTEMRLLKSIGLLNNVTLGCKGFAFDPMNMQAKKTQPAPVKQKKVKKQKKALFQPEVKKTSAVTLATSAQKTTQNTKTAAPVAKKTVAKA